MSQAFVAVRSVKNRAGTMRTPLVAGALLIAPMSAIAADYEVDLGRVLDYEYIRPLIEHCADIGELEDYRDALDAAGDLETLRSLLERLGHVSLRGCPSGADIYGVKKIS